MGDFVEKHLVGILTTIVTSLVVFAASFGTLNAKVEANTQKIGDAVTQREFKLILDGQKEMNSLMEKRFDRIENKLDRIGK